MQTNNGLFSHNITNNGQESRDKRQGAAAERDGDEEGYELSWMDSKRKRKKKKKNNTANQEDAKHTKYLLKGGEQKEKKRKGEREKKKRKENRQSRNSPASPLTACIYILGMETRRALLLVYMRAVIII